MDFKISFKVFDRLFTFRVAYLNFQKMVKTEGLHDLCADGIYRVLYLDYDTIKMPLDMLEKQLKSLQEMHRLSDLYLFKTSKDSFHVVCFDMITTCEINDILRMSSCDDSFKYNWRYDYVPRVLRMTQKAHKNAPKLFKTLKSDYNERTKSLGHIQAYESLLGCNIPNKFNAVKTGIWGIQYATKHNIEKEKKGDN